MHESAFRLHGTLRKTFFDRCGLTFTLNHVLRPELCKFFHSLCGKSQEPNYAPLIKRDIPMLILATVPCKMIAQVLTPPLKNCPDISFTLFIEVAEYCIVPVAYLKLKDTVKCVYRCYVA